MSMGYRSTLAGVVAVVLFAVTWPVCDQLAGLSIGASSAVAGVLAIAAFGMILRMTRPGFQRVKKTPIVVGVPRTATANVNVNRNRLIKGLRSGRWSLSSVPRRNEHSALASNQNPTTNHSQIFGVMRGFMRRRRLQALGRAVLDVGGTDLPGCREPPCCRRALRAWHRPAPSR
jgi:hypothetical protein